MKQHSIRGLGYLLARLSSPRAHILSSGFDWTLQLNGEMTHGQRIQAEDGNKKQYSIRGVGHLLASLSSPRVHILSSGLVWTLQYHGENTWGQRCHAVDGNMN